MFLYVICAASRLPPHSCLLCGVTDALWLHCVFAKAATAAAFLQLLPSYFDTGRSSAILKPYLCVHNECAPRVRPQTWAPHSSLAHTRQPKARGGAVRGSVGDRVSLTFFITLMKLPTAFEKRAQRYVFTQLKS